MLTSQNHEPTVAEIRRECQSIRSCWSAAERSRRKWLAEQRLNRLFGSLSKEKLEASQKA